MTPIDLRSDSLTKPSPQMRAAMAAAEVGDDVYREDPTVNRLETMAAALLGHEASIFLPSGTMANLIAFLVHAKAGQSVLLSASSHSLLYEGGGVSGLAGLLCRAVPDEDGKVSPAAVAAACTQVDDPHFSRSSLLVIENTTNKAGGSCYTHAETESLAALAREQSLRFHCDGARLFNATVALGISPESYGRLFDSIWFSLSKGLGCPAGAILAGSRGFIHEARRYRKMLGGTMRQTGVLAAAGLYALEHGHIEALAEDHRRTRAFRSRLEEVGFVCPAENPTNMLFIRIAQPLLAVGMLAGEGVLTIPHDAQHLRVMLHRDIDDDAASRAAEIFVRVLAPFAG